MQRELTVEDGISILRRRWAFILAATVLGGALGLGATHFIPKRFTSQTLVLVTQPEVSGDFVKPVVSQDTNSKLVTMQTRILSRNHLEPVIRQLGLYQKEINSVSMDELVGRLQKAITVSPVQPMAETRSTGLPGFTVSVNFSDPGLAQQICSTITSLFMEENTKDRVKITDITNDFLQKELDEAKGELDEQDAKLAAFQRRNLGSLPEEQGPNINLLSNLSSQLDATTQALNRLQQDKSFASTLLQQQLADWKEGQAAIAGGRVSDDTLEKQLENLQSQLDAMRARYTDDHPDVIRLRSDIKALREKIAQADAEPPATNDATTPGKAAKPAIEPVQIQALRTQIRQNDAAIQELTARQGKIQQQIKIYQDRVESTPGVAQEYKELTRDYQSKLDGYNDLLKKRSQSSMATDLETRQQGEQFQVLDPANLPTKPSFPNPLLFGGGGFGGGLALSLAVCLLLELQDTSVRTEKDVEGLLHLPVLAAVPTFKPQASQPTADSTLPVALRG